MWSLTQRRCSQQVSEWGKFCRCHLVQTEWYVDAPATARCSAELLIWELTSRTTADQQLSHCNLQPSPQFLAVLTLTGTLCFLFHLLVSKQLNHILITHDVMIQCINSILIFACKPTALVYCTDNKLTEQGIQSTAKDRPVTRNTR